MIEEQVFDDQVQQWFKGWDSGWEGWQGIIDSFKEFVQYEFTHGRTRTFSPLHIKEKFGSLRISVIANDRIHAAAHMAEIMSSKVCMKCGGAGEYRNISGLLITLCDAHATERVLRS